MSTWNWKAERRTAIGDVENQTLEYVAERLLESRKRAFDAEQKAQQLQTKLDAMKAAHAWIKTSERMPELHSSVLGVDHHGDVELLDFIPAFRGEPYFRYTNGHRDVARSVSAWMPLPEPPK